MAVSIAEIIVLGLIAGWLCRQIRLPGLIGMLFVGVALGPYALGYLDSSLLAVGGDLRLIALLVILLRVGFELSKSTLHRIGGRALLLSFIPATCEGVVVCFAGRAILELSWLESALLGSVLAAVSPAVVVPSMMGFIKRRKGVDKDIPTLVMAAASVDDVYVIVVHSVLLGMYAGQQVDAAWRLAGVPISIVLGAFLGGTIGFVLCRLFERFNPRATKRVLVVIACSILLVRLQGLLARFVPIAGLVGAMAIGFAMLERREDMAHEISAKLAKIWVFAEVILFSLVGAQVNVPVAWKAGLAGAAVIAAGLLARGVGTFCCLFASRLSLPERLFVVVSYMPKATVQAAIGAAPLMAMRAAGMSTQPGELILAVAVLSIILTAPAGAWAIAALGERVLRESPEAGRDSFEAVMQSGPDEETL